MKRSTAAAAAVVALVAISSAFATEDLMDRYQKKRDPKARCQTCHRAAMPKRSDPPDLNDLGRTVKKALRPDGTIDWTKVPKT